MTHRGRSRRTLQNALAKLAPIFCCSRPEMTPCTPSASGAAWLAAGGWGVGADCLTSLCRICSIWNSCRSCCALTFSLLACAISCLATCCKHPSTLAGDAWICDSVIVKHRAQCSPCQNDGVNVYVCDDNAQGPWLTVSMFGGSGAVLQTQSSNLSCLHATPGQDEPASTCLDYNSSGSTPAAFFRKNEPCCFVKERGQSLTSSVSELCACREHDPHPFSPCFQYEDKKASAQRNAAPCHDGPQNLKISRGTMPAAVAS